MEIQKLSQDTLEATVELLERVFTYETDPKLWFTNSLDMVANQVFFEEHEIDRIQYWTLIDEGKIVGTTGLYTYEGCDEAWLGWFCVDPEQRTKGLGSLLLNFSIDKAKEWGVPEMCIYTSEHPSEVAAQTLYEGFGFTLWYKEEEDSNVYIYLAKEL